MPNQDDDRKDGNTDRKDGNKDDRKRFQSSDGVERITRVTIKGVTYECNESQSDQRVTVSAPDMPPQEIDEEEIEYLSEFLQPFISKGRGSGDKGSDKNK